MRDIGNVVFFLFVVLVFWPEWLGTIVGRCVEAFLLVVGR